MDASIEFEASRARALATINAAASALKEVRPIGFFNSKFRLSELGDLDALEAIFEEVKGKTNSSASAIYCFELSDAASYPLLHQKFVHRPRSNPLTGEPLCYSRLLAEPDPTALYVGSSKKFPSRFSEHLGRTGGDKTYSMRLRLWAAEVPVDVHLSVWLFNSNIEPGVIELLEQGLWDSKSPMLGKRSGK